MTSPIEQRFAKIVDLLDPIQIVALYLGLINLEELVRADLHPRKHNASGRASYLGDYHRILHRELVSGLAKRDPVKARRVAEELLLHSEHSLRNLGLRLQDALSQDVGE